MALFEPDVFAPFAGDMQHPEGVCWDPVRERVYAGGEGGQIYSVDLDGNVREVANTGGVVLGVAVDGAGLVYASTTSARTCRVSTPRAGRWRPTRRAHPTRRGSARSIHLRSPRGC